MQYLFNETKILVVNWPKWHDKLQYLFCGALYNQWKILKNMLLRYKDVYFADVNISEVTLILFLVR